MQQARVLFVMNASFRFGESLLCVADLFQSCSQSG